MNPFDLATDFIDYDNRRLRTHHQTTKLSLFNKLKVQLPDYLIKDKTVLDLGSCLAAAGYYAIKNGAKEYIGVEAQTHYVDLSNKLLSKYCPQDSYKIIQQEVEDFLDEQIANGVKYDVVLAAGVIYCFLDIVNILKKITMVSKDVVVIDTVNWPASIDSPDFGETIIKRQENMVHADDDLGPPLEGVASRISYHALNIVMSTFAFTTNEGIILPEPMTDCDNDAYRDPWEFENGTSAPARYIVRYNRVKEKPALLKEFFVPTTKTKQWVFDESVAKRFQQEAEAHIPSYHTVIDMCVKFANKNLKKDARIIDVGSALGYTMKRFIDDGYTNVIGVDNSRAMIDNSIFPELVIESDSFPKNSYDFVLANWTVHFIQDKYSYLTDIYDSLSNDGYLILTDKLQQSEIVKREYYDFKRKNGVTEEYIQQKEKDLVGIMHSVSLGWYANKLNMVGFKSVEVIHAELGFTTFLCEK
jgi:cyclopropane fatty-acyl-phospholipid synthase-like methyltransferase